MKFHNRVVREGRRVDVEFGRKFCCICWEKCVWFKELTDYEIQMRYQYCTCIMLDHRVEEHVMIWNGHVERIDESNMVKKVNESNNEGHRTGKV